MAKSGSPEHLNLRSARALWAGRLTSHMGDVLTALTIQFQFSVDHGDLLLLDRGWYVTHTGLVRLARRSRCSGIQVEPATEFCDPAGSRWAFKATVFKTTRCKGFVGYGDADPSNVSALVRGAEMRVAETRAVNRALRKAYGVGICSVEELGATAGPLPPAGEMKKPPVKEPANGNGRHPLRDRLRLLIRQHQLDPDQVKAYGADYCEVAELRQASREQVARFVNHLSDCASHDRDALLCQLNSYAPKPPAPASSDSVNRSAEGEKAEGVA